MVLESRPEIFPEKEAPLKKSFLECPLVLSVTLPIKVRNFHSHFCQVLRRVSLTRWHHLWAQIDVWVDCGTADQYLGVNFPPVAEPLIVRRYWNEQKLSGTELWWTKKLFACKYHNEWFLGVFCLAPHKANVCSSWIPTPEPVAGHCVFALTLELLTSSILNVQGTRISHFTTLTFLSDRAKQAAKSS